MNREKVYDILKTGEHYSIITKYKEVPVKAHLKLSWTDREGNLLGFDWRRSHLKPAFSTLDSVYVKLNPQEYIKTQVFSNLGKELVLSVDDIVSPPEFIKRRAVRVEPDENRPVKVRIYFNHNSLDALASDVSETGVGISLDINSNRDFVEFIKAKLEELREDEFIELSIHVELPCGDVVEGTGRLKNVIGLGKDVYVRVGFEINFPKKEINKIKNYVMDRQKEIVQSLRLLG